MTPVTANTPGKINSIVVSSDGTEGGSDGNGVSVAYTDTSSQSDFLGAGDLLIEVGWSSLNYKDAMALHGDKAWCARCR